MADLAYNAVEYIARRIQEDPDVGYYLGPLTEAHRRVCLVIAVHTGRPLAEVEGAIRYRGDRDGEAAMLRGRIRELEGAAG